MDGREGMALSSPGGYYMQRGMPGSGSGAGSGAGGTPSGLHGPSVFRPLPNPSLQSNVGGGSGFQTEQSSAIMPHGLNVGVPALLPSGEPVKRKRGRPRKYGPDGSVASVALALSPLSSSTSQATSSLSPGQKRGRGRPPGTGRKQQLASLGEWISSSAGMGFTPHVITIAIGEDIAAKIFSFSQQGPRAVCILSASGAVSTVTLRQAATSGGSITYEGRFEILALSGSYMLSDNDGSRIRTGGLSVSLASPDGRVIGGGVGGMLIAASPVQVVVGSFIYGNSKTKSKGGANPESGVESERPTADNSTTPTSIPPSQSLTPVSPVSAWPGPRSIDMRNVVHVDIDLTRG